MATKLPKKTSSKLSRRQTTSRVDPNTIDEDRAKQLTEKMRKCTRNFANALAEIVITRAWLILGYNSFRAFWQAEISEYSYSALLRAKNAIELHTQLEPDVDFGVVPEYVYRDVLRIVEDDRQKVWNNAKKLAGRLGLLRPPHIQQAIENTDARSIRRHEEKDDNPAAPKDYKSIVDDLTDFTRNIIADQKRISEKRLRRLLNDVCEKILLDLKVS